MNITSLLKIALRSSLRPRGCYSQLTSSELMFKTYSTGLPKSLPILTLYTKDICPLCDDAKKVLEKYSNRFSLEEVYITRQGNEEWYRRYRYDIPVFHFNGTFLMKHRVDEKLLEDTLQIYESTR
ncbi:glutaredoxin-like protein C5orf63 homolog [Glandiceps talaboti]